ncbi:hypothetical protein GTQ43_36355, partial [Nostoc sp. KVJ3]|nr:hypothetical protein [Nostoc sp. KVJ3]
YFRSIALLNLERYEDALASTEQSLKLKGDLSAAWENRGVLWIIWGAMMKQ